MSEDRSIAEAAPDYFDEFEVGAWIEGYKAARAQTIEECALIAEGFDAACDSPRMKLFVEAGLVIAVYKRDGEIGAAIRALAAVNQDERGGSK